MKNFSIATRIYSIIGLSLLFSTAAIGFLLYQLNQVSARYDQILSVEIRKQELARVMELTFLKQMLEWNHALMRGHDPKDFDLHKTAFFKLELQVQEIAKDLKKLLANPKAIEQLEKFVAAHDTLAISYHKALEGLAAAKESDFKKVDITLRGQDRPPATMIEHLV